MDLLLELIDRVFASAGWVTSLQKEKGAKAGGGAGVETEDATQAQSDAEGSDGQCRRRRRCGLLVGFDTGRGLELTCDGQRWPSLDCSVNALRRPSLLRLGGHLD